MFCPNCGTQLPDEANFCGTCGTRLNVQPAPQTVPEEPMAPQQEYIPYAPVGEVDPYAMPEAPKKKNRSMLIGIIAAVAVVAVLLVLLLGGGGNGNPEAVAQKFFDSVFSGDIDAAEKCVHPDMREEIFADLDGMEEMLGMFGDSIKITVDGSENVTADEKDDVQELLDEYGINDKLGDIYEVEMTMVINMFGMEQSDTSEILVAEIDGDFYIVDAG